MYGSLYEASLGRNELKLQISSDTKIEVFDSNKLKPTLSLSTAYRPKNRNSGSKRDSAQRRAVGQRQKPGQNVIVWESPVPPPSHDSADGFSVRKPPADRCWCDGFGPFSCPGVPAVSTWFAWFSAVPRPGYLHGQWVTASYSYFPCPGYLHGQWVTASYSYFPCPGYLHSQWVTASYSYFPCPGYLHSQWVTASYSYFPCPGYLHGQWVTVSYSYFPCLGYLHGQSQLVIVTPLVQVTCTVSHSYTYFPISCEGHNYEGETHFIISQVAGITSRHSHTCERKARQSLKLWLQKVLSNATDSDCIRVWFSVSLTGLGLRTMPLTNLQKLDRVMNEAMTVE